jgi:hypothetical protein
LRMGCALLMEGCGGRVCSVWPSAFSAEGGK